MDSDLAEIDEALYAECIANGCTPTLADMLASHSFPGCKGLDRNFLQGRPLSGGQFDETPMVGRHHIAKAEAAGVNVVGKLYNGTLARFPGDPEAWVDSLHDVKTICERRGWSAEGAIHVAASLDSDQEPGPYRVADDLVDDHVAQVLDERPELAPRALEIREEVRGRLSGVHG